MLRKFRAAISAVLSFATLIALVGVAGILVVGASQTRPQSGATTSGVNTPTPHPAAGMVVGNFRTWLLAWTTGNRAIALQYADPNSPRMMDLTQNDAPVTSSGPPIYQDWSQATFTLQKWIDSQTAEVSVRGRVVWYQAGTDPATQGKIDDNGAMTFFVVQRNGRWLVTLPDGAPQVLGDSKLFPTPPVTLTPAAPH